MIMELQSLNSIQSDIAVIFIEYYTVSYHATYIYLFDSEK